MLLWSALKLKISVLLSTPTKLSPANKRCVVAKGTVHLFVASAVRLGCVAKNADVVQKSARIDQRVMIGRWSGSVRLLRQGESGEGADENAGRIFDRKSEERELNFADFDVSVDSVE
jgi:hypothetical protein